MTTTDTLAQAVDAIADRLHERDLDGARQLFDDAAQGRQEVMESLARRLAATVVRPAGMVAWGFGLDIWANPYRDPDEVAWRCGGCPQTGSHYKTDRAAQESAERHVAEDHGGRLAVVSYLDEAYWDAVKAST